MAATTRMHAAGCRWPAVLAHWAGSAQGELCPESLHFTEARMQGEGCRQVTQPLV